MLVLDHSEILTYVDSQLTCIFAPPDKFSDPFFFFADFCHSCAMVLLTEEKDHL